MARAGRQVCYADSRSVGAVAQSGSAPRSHRGGQGFKSPQLHPEDAGRRHAQLLLDRIGSHSGSQVVAFLAWPGVAMAKTASTSTTRPSAATAPITGLVRAGGVAWYRSASVRTGSG